MTNRNLTTARRPGMARAHGCVAFPHVSECTDRSAGGLAGWRDRSPVLAAMQADGQRAAHASTAGDAMT